MQRTTANLSGSALLALLSLMISSLMILSPTWGASVDTANFSQHFSPRLTQPRLAPIGKDGRTAAQQKMLASRPDFNIFKTLAHDPELYARWSGLGQYLLDASTLPPRDREIIILRMGWLCQAPYEWSQHARIAKAGSFLNDAEIHRIAQGAHAPGWSDFERTLLTMVDELRYEAQISDATWSAVRSHYSLEQSIDALYTAGQYQLVSMALNSLGVQLDSQLEDRIPDGAPPPLALEPRQARLTTARLAPLTLQTMTEEQRALVAPQVRDGKLPNLYATLVRHTKFYQPRLRFGSYIMRDSRVPARAREILILRTAWNSHTEYEWAHHVPIARQAGLNDADIARIATGPEGAGWGEEERALLQSADQLRREAFISDATWNALNRHFDSAQVIEIIYTVGGYAMTALAINSLGIQLEDGYPHMPAR